MKYFTRDWYKEMTMMGFLALPESIDEWEESIKCFNENNELGIDYIESLRDDLEENMNDLLKYLPESFHPYIYDGTLTTTYPTPELRKMADEWVKEMDKKTINVINKYNEFFDSVKHLIPINAQKIHKIGMHDARVIDYKKIDRTFELMLKHDVDLKFSFKNVDTLTIPEQLKGRYWLYDEIYPTANGFELRVLLDDLNELYLTTKDVKIDELK